MIGASEAICAWTVWSDVVCALSVRIDGVLDTKTVQIGKSGARIITAVDIVITLCPLQLDGIAFGRYESSAGIDRARYDAAP